MLARTFCHVDDRLFEKSEPMSFQPLFALTFLNTDSVRFHTQKAAFFRWRNTSSVFLKSTWYREQPYSFAYEKTT